MKNGKDLIWFGPPFSYSGYGLHNRAMLIELYKLGWNIKLIASEEHIPPGLIGKELLKSMLKNNVRDPKNTICINLIPPPAIGAFSNYSILFTTLESKTVHPGFFNRCTQFDEVWVPCKDNLKSFLKTGWPKKKVFLCPEGVHTGLYNPESTPLERYKSNRFTFFFCGDWSYRKGVDILIRAYAKAFHPTENVRLLLLTHYQGKGTDDTRDAIAGELPGICNQYNITALPKIEFIYEHLDDCEMPHLFNTVDVGVFPSRGEAWLLPAIQLMSSGKPVITTAWGGQTDYCNNKNSFLIDVEKFDTMHDKISLFVDFYWYQQFAFPSVEHLTKLMRYCYDHPDEVKHKGKKARRECEKNWRWENAAQIANKRLEKIYQARSGIRIHQETGVHTS